MVGGLIALLLGLGVSWLCSPRFRASMERPKYRLLEREAEYDRAATQASCDPGPTPEGGREGAGSGT